MPPPGSVDVEPSKKQTSSAHDDVNAAVGGVLPATPTVTDVVAVFCAPPLSVTVNVTE